MRPTRTVRRESEVTVRVRGKHKPLILIVPPVPDVIVIRPKGHKHGYEVDVLTLYHIGAKLEARKQIEARRARKKQ